MLTFYDPIQADHAPARELHNGDWADYAECPGRADQLATAFPAAQLPERHGDEAILAVHDADYVAFLRAAHDDWLGAGREGDAIPYAFPVVGRRPLTLDRIDARLGRYGFDAATPIAAGTWAAARAGADGALAATEAVMSGAVGTALALCRPPGHHAGRDYFGGYCYLNNAAIAAQAARDAGAGRVAILDVDYHHGNGTQDIFYDRSDVGFVSLHADPRTDYPFYWGHADETGEGEGAGHNRNYPLQRGTAAPEFLEALDAAVRRIAEWRPQILVISYGADTFASDPISAFRLKTEDYPEIGGRIAALDLPTVIVMEGGYAVDDLGANVGAFASGFAD
ncbi:MAG: histone deacetylase family protein [Pseudomonadota bacterium]